MTMMPYPMTKLDNKMKVFSHHMTGREAVAFGVWFNVGSRYEAHRISGISHFIEHLLFKGTPKRSARKIKEEIEGRGGVLNAFTSEDTTCYFVKIMKKHLPLALEVIADMVQYPLFNAADIERERTVIIEEIKMYMDMPAHYAHDLMNTLLWPDQPLGQFIAGDFESMKRVSVNDIQNYFKKHYRPHNAHLAFCGDVAHDDIASLAAGNFAQKKTTGTTSFVKAVNTQRKPRLHFEDKKTEQSHLVIASHALKRTDPDRYALALLHVILGANMSSRLYEEVREKRGLAYEVRSGLSFYEDTGTFSISAGVETSKLEKTITVIMRELGKIRSKKVKSIELVRAKEYLLSQMFFGFDDIMDHMLWLGDKASSFKEIPTKESLRKCIDAITVDDVQRIAQKIFTDTNLNLVHIGVLSDVRKKNITKQFTY